MDYDCLLDLFLDCFPPLTQFSPFGLLLIGVNENLSPGETCSCVQQGRPKLVWSAECKMLSNRGFECFAACWGVSSHNRVNQSFFEPSLINAHLFPSFNFPLLPPHPATVCKPLEITTDTQIHTCSPNTTCCWIDLIIFSQIRQNLCRKYGQVEAVSNWSHIQILQAEQVQLSDIY